MAGNSIGKLFQLTTFGESHGTALGAIVDGCPPGLEIVNNDLQKELNRRKPGNSKYTTQRKEEDKIVILSGVFNGKTTGTPIGLLIYNQDQRSKDYDEIKDKFRPGHADITYQCKYGIRDYRGGGRASARETTMRVAAGAIAKKYLYKHLGLVIKAFVSELGEIKMQTFNLEDIEQNPFFFPNLDQVDKLEQYINSIRKEGDSIGAKVSLIVKNVPVGLGAPVFDRLDADLAKSLMSINAAKAVEIGDGIESVTKKGSEFRDAISKDGFKSNHAGGILGGISTGQDIIVHTYFKATSSIIKPVSTIDIHGKDTTLITKGRHDPCVGIRAVPIVEAMSALTIMDHYLRNVAQNHNVDSSFEGLGRNI